MVKQIAVFLENRKGSVSEFCEVLAKAGVNLLKLSIADTEGYGILRCITKDTDKAVSILKNAGFTVKVNELIGVETEDVPGGLFTVLKLLEQAKIEIDYLYSFVSEGGKSVILFQIEEKDDAVKALKSGGINLIDNI